MKGWNNIVSWCKFTTVFDNKEKNVYFLLNFIKECAIRPILWSIGYKKAGKAFSSLLLL